MMIPFSKYILPAFLCLGMSVTFLSCTDDISLTQNNNSGEYVDEFNVDLENSLMIPFSLSIDQITGTRDDNVTAQADEDLKNGTATEHAIDFDRAKECFAIFFDDNDNFMYIQRLYKHSSLGNGNPVNDGVSEYRVYAVAYIDRPENYDDLISSYKKSESGEIVEKTEEEIENDKIEAQSLLPAKVLVVLNGSRIYDKLLDFCQNADETWNTTLTSDEFLEFKWSSQDSWHASGEKDRVIGVNNQGRFAMTNSAYYDYDRDDEGNEVSADMKLQTVVKLNKDKILPAFASNITPDNKAATIYVERMVAKFSAPKFNTAVIGSDKMFRPSEDAQSVVIYEWVNNGTPEKPEYLLKTTEVDWRIHVLGWTINGRETENYLFKKIATVQQNNLTSWDNSDWNDPDHKRSYWSIDPHYDKTPIPFYDENGNETGTFEPFYPWQYRGAVDFNGISYEHHPTQIVLRYVSFNQLNYWDENSLTISENTFSPDDYPAYQTVDKEDDKDKVLAKLDGRASTLVGPHLLVSAEIYIAHDNLKDNDYIDNFSKVKNLYGDRYFRYYLEEKDCFRMFVKEMNDALVAQENMTFHIYDWKGDSGKDDPDIYVIQPTGHCGLIFDCDLGDDYRSKLTEDEEHIYDKLCGTVNKTDKSEGTKSKYHLMPVEDMIEQLYADNIPVSYDASVKNGDGRILFWIPGMVFRNLDDKTSRLPVYKKVFKVEDNTTKEELEEITSGWTTNMRKSLIYEWFGPVDHFANGYMYYAADIPHHIINSTDKTGYYGSVRNHWYSFTVTSINSLGTPVSNVTQPIIPGNFNYRDQISVYLQTAQWHIMKEIEVQFK